MTKVSNINDAVVDARDRLKGVGFIIEALFQGGAAGIRGMDDESLMCVSLTLESMIYDIVDELNLQED